MSQHPKVVIVIARCRHSHQTFGIRFEAKQSNTWIADWAFAIKEVAAKREGYDRGKIEGNFHFDAAYPGCPNCHATGIFKCPCSKVACWDGESGRVTCPWCRSTSQISGQIESLRVGRDR